MSATWPNGSISAPPSSPNAGSERRHRSRAARCSTSATSAGWLSGGRFQPAPSSRARTAAPSSHRSQGGNRPRPFLRPLGHRAACLVAQHEAERVQRSREQVTRSGPSTALAYSSRVQTTLPRARHAVPRRQRPAERIAADHVLGARDEPGRTSAHLTPQCPWPSDVTHARRTWHNQPADPLAGGKT